jgi:transcription antitermination protein NusB
MLNRRHLRIRVLQVLYAWQQSPDKDLAKAEKSFLKSLHQVEELYIFLLLYIVELRDYAANFMEDSKNKKLLTEADVNPNTKFIDNLFINSLKDDTALLTLAGAFKLSFSGEKEMIRNIYFTIRETEEFQEYMEAEGQDFETDKKFISKLFGKHLVEEEIFQGLLEEKNIHWDDDFPFITSMVIKTIKDASEGKIELSPLFKDKEDKQFALDLFRKTTVHADRFTELISSKTNNWEIERVAQIDLLMMQMALTEILEMPTVPVKVAMNEYIDMAKYYSTPKSKSFVNGILDSILMDFKRDGAIKKTGRGLIE